MTMTFTDFTGVDIHAPRMIELEITRRCEGARCLHCYSNSGPSGGTGTMTTGDWRSLIEQAAAYPRLDTVQFIGGEPTDHPEFLQLAHHALGCGLRVAVFTNFIASPKPAVWGLYADGRVTVSTSWYSADPAEHDQITRTPGSWAATLANITEAINRGVKVKAGIVGVLAVQDMQGGAELLAGVGVTSIRIDHARPVGRALERGQATTDDDLCGGCGRGRTAVDTNGRLMPCVLGRHRSAGNVRVSPLAELLTGQDWQDMVSSIHGDGSGRCGPSDSNDCDPAM